MREWRPCPEWPEYYEVSNDGAVWSKFSKRKKSIWKDRDGYCRVSLMVNQKAKCCTVHSLVLRAFSSIRPNGYECSHLNGKKDDNHIDNLRWVTHSENERTKELHGTSAHGERNGSSKLTWSEVRWIRQARTGGAKLKDLSALFGVSQAMISAIARGKNWTTRAAWNRRTP